MANFISLTGFVSSDIQISQNGKNCSFSISFYDTRRNNEPVYSFMTVKVFDFSATPRKKDLVNVIGSLHKHTWNGKEYTEIWCNYDGWSKVERRNREDSSSNAGSSADSPKTETYPTPAQIAEAEYNSGSNGNNASSNSNADQELSLDDIPF